MKGIWVVLVCCLAALSADAASTSKNVAISVTHMSPPPPGCLSGSICPTPPAGFHWVNDFNYDFTQGSLPAGWQINPDSGTVDSPHYGTPQLCHQTSNGSSLISFDGNGMRVKVPDQNVQDAQGHPAACDIDTFGAGHIYGPGFYEYNAAYDVGSDYATWIVGLQDNDCKPSSAGWEIDMPEAGVTSTFYSGYGTCFTHPPDQFCSGCWQAFPTFQLSGNWWVADGDNIQYYNGTEYARFSYPNGAGDLTTIPPGNLVIIENRGFIGGCGQPDGTTCSGGLWVKWFRHYVLAPG